MIESLIYLVSFLCVVTLTQSVANLIFSNRDTSGRVNRRLTLLKAGRSREEVFTDLLRAPNNSKLLSFTLPSLNARLARLVRQAGVRVPTEQLILRTVAVALALWLVALMINARLAMGVALLANAGLSFVAALTLAAAGLWVWLSRRRRIRIKQIEDMLPTALDIINRAVRAGHPVLAAIQLAGEELADPIGSELGLIVDETTYGVDLEQALVNFADRTGSQDAKFFAASVSVQATTGGNLTEILEGLARVVRGRATLAKRVKSLSSEGRTSALIISAMPIFIIGVQTLVHPAVYIEKASDPIFMPAVFIAVTLYVVGWLVVQRIINFKY